MNALAHIPGHLDESSWTYWRQHMEDLIANPERSEG